MNAPTARDWLETVDSGVVEYRDGRFSRDGSPVMDDKVLRELVLSGLAVKVGSLLKLTTAGTVELTR